MKKILLTILLCVFAYGCGTTGPFQRYVQVQDFTRWDATQEELRKDFTTCEDEAKLNIHYENILIEIKNQNEYIRRCMERKSYQFKP